MNDISDTVDSVRDRTRRKIERDLGPSLMSALNDPAVIEIMANADGQVWVDRLGQGMSRFGEITPERARAVIEAVAGFHSKAVTRLSPLLEGELPVDGSRFAGQLPPVVPHPAFTIRKRALSLHTIADYEASGSLSAAHARIITDAVFARRNILVVGGTGSGKTTLVNAIIAAMVAAFPHERFVLIEDTAEIQCAAPNHMALRTSPDITMTALLRATLRMRPDRILVGEVRGPEALDLLTAWNTGHEGGAATLHANNARAGLDRLAMLISMHQDAPRPIEPLIGDAVHLIIHIARTDTGGRRVSELLGVHGFRGGRYETTQL